MRRKMTSTAGFSLIDTLVGMTILTIATNALIAMLMTSIHAVRANALNGHAVALAVQEREDLRSLTYASIATRDPYTSGAPDRFQGVAFTVHSEVQNDRPALNMKTITVTASWSYAGRVHSYALDTIYTNING